MNGRLLALLVSLLAVSWSAPALAWSAIGHRIICEIASRELKAPARERVKEMIRRDPEFDTFAEACTWPDRPQRRGLEHCVNLPRGASGFVEDACPLADECVISAIREDLAVLSSSSATEQDRLEALKYLGHWVGDVHQPLHFEDDRGGNEIGVSGGLCYQDLHAVWDHCIIERGLPGDPYSLARDLLEQVTDEDRAAWRASRPIDWTNESFAISISPEVRYCIRTESGCWYDAQNERLGHGEPERTVAVDRAYIEANAPMAKDRLVKAGIRLADLPNKALRGWYRAPDLHR